MNSPPANNATTRFSNRVQYYVKYRPTYPPGIIEFLGQTIGLTTQSVIADIGSGTGLLSELFLKHGNLVYGVEPNLEMRQAGEVLLKDYPNFYSINGSAELTTLSAETIDVIVAGQAFHWFDVAQCRQEFQRILKPGAWIALIWNERQTDSTPFLQAFEAFLHRFSTDYQHVNHKNVDADVLRAFFGGDHYQLQTFPNTQVFDYAGLEGRVLSSSYIPLDDDPNYEVMLTTLKQLFTDYQAKETVSFLYDTRVFYGQLE